MARFREGSQMSPPPGRVVRGIRRAFYANPGHELTTRDLWEWTHPRETQCKDAMWTLEADPRIAAAALVERVLEQWAPERAREVVARLVDEAFREQVAELREREQISKRVGSALR
jgi:hypothetical protein